MHVECRGTSNPSLGVFALLKPSHAPQNCPKFDTFRPVHSRSRSTWLPPLREGGRGLPPLPSAWP